MTNRPIPYDEGAEGALLGAMLLSPSAIETAERTLVSSPLCTGSGSRPVR